MRGDILMKTMRVFNSAVLVLVFIFGFIYCQNQYAIGQTSKSPTSTSTKGISSSSSSGQIVLNKEFIGIWKEDPINLSLSSSSSGNPGVISMIVSSSSGSISKPATPVSNSTSSGSTSTMLTGKPQVSTQAGTLSSSSSGGTKPISQGLITLQLCLINGKLEGTIREGEQEKLSIGSQKIISENEVIVDISHQNNKTDKLKLKLLSNRQLKGHFDNGRIFKARKVNSSKGCTEGNKQGTSSSGNIQGTQSIGASL